MYPFNKIFIFLFFMAGLTQAAEIKHTKWRLKEDLLEIEDSSDSFKKHSIRFGYSRKNVNSLKLISSEDDFRFNSQQIPGLNFEYKYDFQKVGLINSLYTQLGYFTKYNDLGTEGYADLTVFDGYMGYSIGYSFLKKVQVVPRLVAGIGSAYYFQRGDVREVSAEANYLEAEYGVQGDIYLPSEDVFPSSWSSSYILSLKLTSFSSLSGETSIEGNKIVVSFGVEI
ncbi:hypothetical protein N9N67_07430 [Bacteriovoracaceae bacterium]|nr:hypothetical protein [Bacteriovoracaceae bacterium]